MAAKHENHERP